MIPISKTLSTTQAAKLIGVGHTTVGYWIRSRQLPIFRKGRNYRIDVADLVHFLKRTGQPIPHELDQDLVSFPYLRPCHQFHEGTPHGERCEECVVKREKVFPCFQARQSASLGCPEPSCLECRYYRELILPRIGFIHQINQPSVVIQDLFFWGGNQQWAERAETTVADLIGMGVETVFHPDCIGEVLGFFRKRAYGKEPSGSRSVLSWRFKGGSEIEANVIGLSEPVSWLVVG
jgi:excisionase family DNA binding protein